MRSVHKRTGSLPPIGIKSGLSANDPLAVVTSLRQDCRMEKPIQRLRLIVDKEWIKVGWAGTPTLRHQFIALGPAIIVLVPSLLIERWSYAVGIGVLGGSFVAYGVMIIWIHIRRMAGLGYFSTKRSDRVAKRSRRRRERAFRTAPIKGPIDGS